MKFRVKTRELSDQWHDYFVWFPRVIKDISTGFRMFVWLETVRVRRQYCKWGAYWEYKIKDKYK
jgi:hypothetical protein